MNIEQILSDTKPLFQKAAQEAMEAVMGKVYEEYLPHVENDNYFNVHQQAEKWIKNFLADALTEDDLKIKLTYSWDYTAQRVRNKIYEENKEEITKAVGEDMVEQLRTLQERHSQSWEFKY